MWITPRHPPSCSPCRRRNWGPYEKSVSIGYFNGLKVCNFEVVVSHLQYADDPLFIGDAIEM